MSALAASADLLHKAYTDYAKATGDTDPNVALPDFRVAAASAVTAAVAAQQTIPSSQPAFQAAAASVVQSANASLQAAQQATDPGTAANAANQAIRSAEVVIGYAQQASPPPAVWVYVFAAALFGFTAGSWYVHRTAGV